ncbi:MAG TPA: tetratricopeptide repeat protein [Stellaceae bacterium]|nr:tetratricopeptide repeat protein [Stellaceae bacterium]
MAIEPVAATPIRRLTAVLLADVVGYSRMMSRDEDATHARVALHVRELIDPTIVKYGGRPVRSMGDGMLVEFASALDAVHCALDIQRGLAERQADEPDRVQLRIGINTGDVLVDQRDIYGNSVNITARLEALAAPGTVCVSQSIYDQTRSQPSLFFADRGMHRVKNIDYPIHVFEVAYEPIRVPFLARCFAHRTGWAVAGTVGMIALASAAGLLTFGEQEQVAARTNSIIVLPFRNVDGNPADNYLADAITDDLTTELSRLRRAWVIASATALTYKGKTIDVRQIGREIGVRYALEGSVKRAGPIVQVNAQLIDTENGTNLWANRFQYKTSSLLDLQDAVTGRIASSLDDQVIKVGVRHEIGTLAADGNPLDERLRAMAANTGMLTPQKSLETRHHAEAGLQADPDNARLLGLLANVLVADYLNAWNGAGTAEVDRAERDAGKALSLDPDVAAAHLARGLVRRIRGDHQGALAAFEEAIRLDPNFARAYAQSANELVFLGRAKEAIPMAEKAAELSPKDPSIGVFRWVEGRAYFTLGDYPHAIKWLEESVRLRPNLWFNRAWLTAAYALNGQHAEAQELREKLEKAFPKYDFAQIAAHYGKENRFNNATLKTASAELFKGLREAGLK